MPSQHFVWALLVALVAQAGLSRAALDAQATTGDGGLDASFLSSWLKIDSATAERLSTDGADAVARRRSLMATASTTGSFGAAELPGAYPPPPPPEGQVAVGLTSCLKGETVATFTPTDQAALIELVQQQAALAGSTATTTTIEDFVFDPTCGGLKVRTQTRFPRLARGAAQEFEFRMEVSPGPSAPWLQTKFPGSSVSGVTPPPNIPTCTQAQLCKRCPVKPGVCTKCAATTGKPGTANFYTVYSKQGKCFKCTAPGCSVCWSTGQCKKCKVGFRNVNNKCIRICRDPLCASCPKGAKQCDRCKVSVGVFGRPTYHTVYMDLFKTCRACKLYGCRVCRRTGTCLQCKFGFEPNGFGGCRLK